MKINLFEGKSPAERNKMIAAIVLGVLALIAVTWGIILPSFSGKKTRVTVNVSPTPTPETRTTTAPEPVAPLPGQQEIDSIYTTIPVVYGSGGFSAPPPGRNIFAFYEPPKPTPYSPTPTPPPRPPTPTPTPTPPPIFVAYLTPTNVYAGTDGFRLEVNGDRFPEDAVILFNGTRLPTTYISPQGLVAQVPGSLIVGAGEKELSVIAPDGKFSNLVKFNVQEPPKPPFQYIGMISRKRNNNDTAYFQEKNNDREPIAARLNDVVGGRFRLKSISAEEVVFEDVNLGFRHKLDLYRPEPGENTNFGGRGGTRTGRPGTIDRRRNNRTRPQQQIPGIPNNIPRYQPTPRPTPQPGSGGVKQSDN